MTVPTLHTERLKALLSIPTAPFREIHVIEWFKQELLKSKVPFFIDTIGNIVIGARSAAEYKTKIRKASSEPLRFFIAHTDHPGFHGIEWISPTQLKVKWHGGTPIAHLEGAPVWLADPRGEIHAVGTVREAKLAAHGKAIDEAVIQLQEPLQLNAGKVIYASDVFGGFRFRSHFWMEDEKIYTKAADDLVGAFAIVETAIALWKSKSTRRNYFMGLLSRAEEVGFIGTLGHLQQLQPQQGKTPLLAVSLETSRTLPGAEIGKGPVVRLGDRSTVFHSGLLHQFAKLAAKVLPEAHQKRIMDGGSCEASAAIAYGLQAVGISVPLGNYHNQSLEGGPDAAEENGPAPEFVHKSDIEGMMKLCMALMTEKVDWKFPWKNQQKEFQKLFKRYQPYLSKKENKKWVKSKSV